MKTNIRQRLLNVLKPLLVWWALLGVGALFALGETPTLLQNLTNYPNPFDSRHQQTIIAYQLTESTAVRVRIYDLFGYRVREFYFPAGSNGALTGDNKIFWDGTDENGSKVSKGGYVCQVLAEGSQTTRATRKIGVIH